MELKHTRGPWKWWTSNSYRRLSSEADGKDGGVICPTVSRSGWPDLIVKDDDMFLIAAAPELLEALQDALHAYDKHGEDPSWDFARAAIAKATGH